jgi:hypothetical protein
MEAEAQEGLSFIDLAFVTESQVSEFLLASECSVTSEKMTTHRQSTGTKDTKEAEESRD